MLKTNTSVVKKTNKKYQPKATSTRIQQTKVHDTNSIILQHTKKKRYTKQKPEQITVTEVVKTNANKT